MFLGLFSFSSRNLSYYEFSRFSPAVNCIGPRTLSVKSWIGRLPKSIQSQKVFKWVRFLWLIHLDRLFHLRSRKPLGSWKIKTVASLSREMWAITPKKNLTITNKKSLLKKNLTYSSIFKAYFMKSFAAAKGSLVFIKSRCS